LTRCTYFLDRIVIRAKIVRVYSEKDIITDVKNGVNIQSGVKIFKHVIYGRVDMEWDDYNWTMKDKGEEIFVFFEIFCLVVIVMTACICKVVDWIER